MVGQEIGLSESTNSQQVVKCRSVSQRSVKFRSKTHRISLKTLIIMVPTAAVSGP